MESFGLLGGDLVHEEAEEAQDGSYLRREIGIMVNMTLYLTNGVVKSHTKDYGSFGP